MEALRSPENPAFRALSRLLKEARARREAGRAVVEGPHLVAEAVKAGVAREVWVTPEAMESAEGAALLQKVRSSGTREKLIAAALLRRAADTETPQGWMAVVEPGALKAGKAPTLMVALDALQDPGNLGTVLRCAWAAGAGLMLGPGCADAWAPKVLRAGAGAHFHVPLQQPPDLPKALLALAGKGFQVVATAPRAPLSYLDADLRQPTCVVLGGEGAGLSPAVAAACGRQLRIPYPGSAESLNAAVSGAIVLFEALRQRH